MQHQQDPQLSATHLRKFRPINLSTSSGWWASSTKRCHLLLVNINLKTATKFLSALLYILRPYPRWTCLRRFCRFLAQPSHLPSTKTQVPQPLLEGCCNETSASDLKWVASSFPSPVHTVCLQLCSILGILSLIGFLDVVFPWYCQFPKNHLLLRSWPYDYVWLEICNCHFHWKGSTSTEVCCYLQVIGCSQNVPPLWADAIASWSTTFWHKVDKLNWTIGVIWQICLLNSLLHCINNHFEHVVVTPCIQTAG